jgi:hypothetical protein
MATVVAGSGGCRNTWMVDCDCLGNRRVRSMASELVDRKTLGCLHSCAKDHAPKGEVDFNCDPHLTPLVLTADVASDKELPLSHTLGRLCA